MQQDVRKTYKSEDTEEWLDKVFTRPIGYLWARWFQRLGVHPNVVTILSILIGISSAFCFAHGSWRTEGTTGLLWNALGVVLMMWANFYDSADGQLARITGKQTQLGRILDGAASIIIFVPVYCAIVWRAYQYHAMEFRWLGLSDTPQHALAYGLTLFAIALFSGFVCHSGQCRLSDYYRQIHLFFLKGEKGSELSSSPLQQQRYNAMPWKGHLLEKLFQKTYVNYTLQQERSTPEFQRLKQSLTQTYGGVENMPQPLRDAFRRRSLPLMPLTNILTFNTRAITLYICCLIDLPWLYFLIETIVLSALCEYMRRRHERMSAELRLEFQIDS